MRTFAVAESRTKAKQNPGEYKNQEMGAASEIELLYLYFTFGKRGMIRVAPWGE